MIRPLESMRGICALIVAISHVQWATHAHFSPYVANAWLFVDFFFVLSGFVIALSYSRKIESGEDLKSFMLKRVFRLYPLHLVTLVAVLSITLAWEGYRAYSGLPPREIGDPAWQIAVALQLILSHGIGLTEASVLNDPSWSISTEFYAYMVAGGLFLVFGARLAGQSAWAILILLAGVVVYLINGETGLFGDMTARLARCLYGFGIGVLAYRAFEALRPHLERQSYLPLLSLVIAAAWFWIAPTKTAANFSYPLVFAVLIVSIAAAPKSRLARALEWSPLVWLGTVSYSIYMVHWFWTLVFGWGVNRFFDGHVQIADLSRVAVPLELGTGLLAIYLPVVLLTSHITYTFIESPGRDLGRRLTGRRGRAAAAVRAGA